MEKIRTNDEVIVITGRDKGKRGLVKKMLSNNKILVENVNMVKRHTKADPNNNVVGGIVEKEAPLDRSNVKIFNANTSKGDKVGIRLDKDGKNERYFKSDNKSVAG